MKRDGLLLAALITGMGLAALLSAPHPPPNATLQRLPAQRDIVRTNGRTQIDLNRADAALLEELPGIGPATAKNILDYRAEHGFFASVEGLRAVPGIGPARLDAIKDYLTVDVPE